jgi:hypothetical protein
VAERVNLVELRGAIEKATAEVLKNHVMPREPIVVGFVAPEAISAQDAQAIAEKVSAASGLGGRPTVIDVGASHAGQSKETLPNPIGIIIGYILNS